jgi:hypothetical protein
LKVHIQLLKQNKINLDNLSRLFGGFKNLSYIYNID